VHIIAQINHMRRIFDIWKSSDRSARESKEDESSPSSPTASASQIAQSNNSSSNNRIKFVVLVLLCCQNAGHALTARYSQAILKENYSSTGIFLSK
jgi:hypothetical protein